MLLSSVCWEESGSVFDKVSTIKYTTTFLPLFPTPHLSSSLPTLKPQVFSEKFNETLSVREKQLHRSHWRDRKSKNNGIKPLPFLQIQRKVAVEDERKTRRQTRKKME